MDEQKMLREISHPHIMKVHEILQDRAGNSYMACELLGGGELQKRIDKGGISEKNTKYVIKQVLLALKYMHNQGKLHRDLKPENILLESKDEDCWEIKVADFGFAR